MSRTVLTRHFSSFISSSTHSRFCFQHPVFSHSFSSSTMVLHASAPAHASTSTDLGSSECTHSAVNQAYDEAVRTLNSLQSNKATIEKIRKQRDKLKYSVVPNVRRQLEQIGINDEDLRNLSVIHVSGTKGKGSTCAFTESILRHHGFKTGFFSSPHLVEVRERIRIDGEPLPRKKFAEYFWNVSYLFCSLLDTDSVWSL